MVIVALLALLGIVSGQFNCITCKAAVGQGRNYILTDSEFKDKYLLIVQQVCVNVFDSTTCSGYINDLASILWSAVLERFIQPDYLCYLIKQCDDGAPVMANFDTWAQELLADKPEQSEPTQGEATMAFAQITDMHFDKDYASGTSPICVTPPCCRSSSGSGSSGYWGDYECDLPQRTFTSLINELQSHNLEFIIWTGDSAPHDRLNTNRQSQIQAYISTVTDQLLSSISYLTTPVYPVIGEFDCDPVDQYDFSESNWLTKYLRAQWTPWLSTAALVQLEKTGSYVQRHKNTNLNIISINTNACNINNLYLLGGVTDPGDQLQFLIDSLKNIEQDGEYAYIIGHIPPGSDKCLNDWSMRYNAIIDRFQNTVRGQFFGHDHDDSLKLTRGVYDSTPTGTMWIAPPATSYGNRNPSYREYTADTTTFGLMDYTQYRMDLAAANANAGVQPVWSYAYKFREEYYVSDLQPDSLLSWVTNYHANELKAIKYLQNMHTMGPLTPSTCDSDCRERILCDVTNPTPLEAISCKNMTTSWENYIMTTLYGPWLSDS